MAYQTRECLTCGRIQQKEIGYITRFSATAAPPPSSLSAQALVQAAYPDEPNERDEDDEEGEDED